MCGFIRLACHVQHAARSDASARSADRKTAVVTPARSCRSACSTPRVSPGPRLKGWHDFTFFPHFPYPRLRETPWCRQVPSTTGFRFCVGGELDPEGGAPPIVENVGIPKNPTRQPLRCRPPATECSGQVWPPHTWPAPPCASPRVKHTRSNKETPRALRAQEVVEALQRAATAAGREGPDNQRSRQKCHTTRPSISSYHVS